MSIIKNLPENWQAELETMLMEYQRDFYRKRAYICSPLRGDNMDAVRRNINAARFYMYYAATQMNVLARAPHAYLPMLLCDDIARERALAIRFGQEFIELHDELYVCGCEITMGMRGEIDTATQLGMRIITFDPGMCTDVRKIVTRSGVDKQLVTLNQARPELANSPEGLFREGAA